MCASALQVEHMTEITPSELEWVECDNPTAQPLLDRITGRDFLEQYSTHDDAVTTIEPGRTYAVRMPTAHPVHEHQRVPPPEHVYFYPNCRLS
eukprot:SAG31_NODE_39054_length_291_cov_0.807292_1_plen_92_part_01